MSKSKLRRIFLIINIILLAAIAWVLWNRYYSRDIRFNLTYGEKPVKLLDIVNKYFPNQDKKRISVVYIFNEMPTLNDLDAIGKLHRKHKDRAIFNVFFHKKFQWDAKVDYPYRFVSNIKLHGDTGTGLWTNNYLILLRDGEIKSFESSLKIANTNFVIEKAVNPGKEFKDFTFSAKRLKARLIKDLKQGKKTLRNLLDDGFEEFPDFTSYSKIYFIVSECTTCELKRLVQRMKEEQILGDTKNLVIFPMQAMETELKAMIDFEGIQLPVYIDYYDQFNLLPVITGKKNNLFEIEKKDLEE